MAPNKYAAWTGAGYYGGTPVPIPLVRLLSEASVNVNDYLQDFGCTDFKAYNINFENRAVYLIPPQLLSLTDIIITQANGGVGPALALGIGFANASFYASTFRGMQDTMFIGKNGSAVFRKSQVLGSVYACTSDFVCTPN